MKKIFFMILSFFILLSLLKGMSMTDNFLRPAFSGKTEKTEALVFLGGKKYDQQAFLEIFKGMPDVEITPAIHPNANRWFESDSIDAFDVLVFYDMAQEITENQKSAMTALFEKGIGAVFLHHSICNYQSWKEYEKIIGGRFYLDIDENQDRD